MDPIAAANAIDSQRIRVRFVVAAEMLLDSLHGVDAPGGELLEHNGQVYVVSRAPKSAGLELAESFLDDLAESDAAYRYATGQADALPDLNDPRM